MLTSSIVRVDQLCCGMEATLIRDTLGPIAGVEEIKVSVTDRRVCVQHTQSVSADFIVEALNAKHLGASLQTKAVGEVQVKHRSWGDRLRLAGVAAQVFLFAAALGLHLETGYEAWVDGLSTVCVALSLPLARDAVLAVLRKTPNVEFLMAVAMLGSLCQGALLESASVGAIVTIMDHIKTMVTQFVERRLGGMLVAAPEAVDLDGGGSKLLKDLTKGDIFLARAGDRIAADGLVVGGKASVDESQVTGEAMPQEKGKDTTVHSGSMVESGFLKILATSKPTESFDGRVAEMVRDAKGTLSETEAIVNRFAVWYTPSVILLAVAAALARQRLQPFLVIIVAGCPCALLGAAPFVHGACISVLASRCGLLVKSTNALEALAGVRYLGFDKTGTLTTGKFQLERLHLCKPFASGGESAKAEILRIVAAVEQHDSHPLARALVQSYTGCVAEFTGATERALPEVKEFARQGRAGVTGVVDDDMVGVGNVDFLRESGIELQGTGAAKYKDWSRSGPVLFCTINGQVAALMQLQDQLRSSAPAAVSQLGTLGVRAILLTGDKSAAVRQVSQAVGIAPEDTHSGLLPEDKAALVLKLTWPEQGQKVAVPEKAEDLEHGGLSQPLVHERGPVKVGFIGDGLNDCPALATANVGIVLQEVGSHETLEAASAVLEGAAIEKLPAVVVFARRANRLVMVNIALACGINAAVILLALADMIPLWLSVVMDNTSFLIVLLNSLWPLCWHP